MCKTGAMYEAIGEKLLFLQKLNSCREDLIKTSCARHSHSGIALLHNKYY
jgi:hypothetical protein